ncbi:MAG: hypothetical protein ACRD22_07950 [Terriglobia bacterium]
MLIRTIELIKSEEPFSGPIWISAEAEKKSRCITSRGFYSFANGDVVLFPPTRGEMKPSVLCTAISPNEFPSSVVQCRPQIMNGVSNHQRKSGWNILSEARFYGNCARLRIAASDEFMGVCLYEGAETKLQISDVLIGPFDL